jgi:thioredoxin-related protein
LSKAAAHLSTSLINQHSKILDDELRGKTERYISFKVGNIAPDIQLTTTKKLSDTGTNILLVFGSSECGHCIDDKKKLENHYPKWQEKGNIEVVYISIDTNKTDFETTYKNTPWETYCDFKGWENQAVKDCFINATPTYVLLDKDLKILIHPKSVAHVDTWVNYKL